MTRSARAPYPSPALSLTVLSSFASVLSGPWCLSTTSDRSTFLCLFCLFPIPAFGPPPPFYSTPLLFFEGWRLLFETGLEKGQTYSVKGLQSPVCCQLNSLKDFSTITSIELLDWSHRFPAIQSIRTIQGSID